MALTKLKASNLSTDADEHVDDRIAALIVGGNNITATYNDAAGTLTIDGQPGYADSDVAAYLSANVIVGTVGTSLPSPVSSAGSLFYNTATEIFYISNGTVWSLVSNSPPQSTGGTVTIGTLAEGSTFSYNLGLDFEDDVDTDGSLVYTLFSGTMPPGCTLPTAGNSAFTGTAGAVSSNTNYTWIIRATDTSGGTANQNYQQTITNVVPITTGGTVTIAAVNEDSSASYDVDTNFTFPTGSVFSAYSLQSGSLPSGLSLNTSTGVISGTMVAVSSTTAYSFTIRATDTDGDTADQLYSWTITNMPFVATGGTVTTYSSGGIDYKVNTFTSSGTITFNKAGTVDYLVVAGGGAGGNDRGGGGGAGGYRTGSLSITASGYSVVVGAGGARSTDISGGTRGANGNNSSFSTITSLGGGNGGPENLKPGADGGSGGGTSYGSTSPGQGTSGQGNNGGVDGGGAARNTGGGGGASAVGASGTGTGSPPHGGNGLSSSINGTATTRAGGGGGGSCLIDSTGAGQGTGGSGGGGNGGANSSQGTAGSANTGGGGGGGGGVDQLAGSGGSGIVIIRYAV